MRGGQLAVNTTVKGHSLQPLAHLLLKDLQVVNLHLAMALSLHLVRLALALVLD